MQHTPVIPPMPSPEGGHSPIPAPVVPPFSPPNQPAPWPEMAPNMNGTPYPQNQYLSPHSYFIPPSTLPGGIPSTPIAPVGPTGLSTDWTGFPNIHGATPQAWTPAGTPLPSHPQTPYTQPQPAPPGTQYSAFQQPLPPGYMYPVPPQAPQGWPPGYATPYVQVQTMPGWPGTPWGPPMQPFPPQYAPPPQQVPHHQRPPPEPARIPRLKEDRYDGMDKFAEGLHYGPVLDPMLVKRLKANVQINPLLLPPPDDLNRPYLKWNMLFSTAQCTRSKDPPMRSWYTGRGAPATWPRVTTLHLISYVLPWFIEVHATEIAVGVTCGDVIEAIHKYMYERVSKKESERATPAQQRINRKAFWHNRSTSPDVPGGRLPQTLLRCDWLGDQTMYGGIIVNEKCVNDICKAPLPCTFELKLLQRYQMSEEEIREMRERQRQADDTNMHPRGRRSRSGTTANSSRAQSRAPSQGPVVDA